MDDSTTSSYISTGLQTPVELSSVVYEPGPDAIGIWATDHREGVEVQLLGRGRSVLNIIADTPQKSFVDEIEMVERGI